MTLKSIEEHNAERRRIQEERYKSRPTSVACPECGAELLKHSPHWSARTITYTDPPSEAVWCPHCKWRGSILA